MTMPISQPRDRASAAPGPAGFMPSRRAAGYTSLRRPAVNGFTPSRRSAVNGFTLIEMLVVLAILSLVAVAAAQRLGHRPAGLIREEAEAKLDLALDAARREAGRTGEVQIVDPTALIPGATLAGSLPPPPGTLPGGRTGLILIYPDSSSNGGIVSADGREVARIDWLTGEARDAS